MFFFKKGIPELFLAPMEGVGDRAFRIAMAEFGGFDHATTEFIRVPSNAHVQSLAKVYNSNELKTMPLTPQIMGSDPELVGAMAFELQGRGALRIDLNCGCPSSTVTGRGAGSSLLKNPKELFTVASAMKKAVSIPVTAKLRSGFNDTSLFKENILAAQESGISFITVHPRTKVDGYGPPANWDLIAQAVETLKIPVVGNGDIKTVEDAKKMLDHTKCTALMIGRGAISNPWIFWEIKFFFENRPFVRNLGLLHRFFKTYLSLLSPEIPQKNRLFKIKQLASYLFLAKPFDTAMRHAILRHESTTAEDLIEAMWPLLSQGWDLYDRIF